MSQMTTIATLMVTRLWLRPRHRRALDAAIGPDGINTVGFAEVAGIEHFRTIRGADKRNPVMVFVHGGPGATQTIFNPTTIPWERHVTVVQYDQRGSGKTLQRSGAAPDLTLDRLETDAIAMIESLRDELGIDQVILAGSSVGSAIALGVAARRPDLVSAYVGVDQLASPESRQLSRQLTVEGLHRYGNRAGLTALEQLEGAKLTPEVYGKIVHWTMEADPNIPHMVNDVIIPALLTSPLHTTRDAKLLDVGMKASTAALFDEIGSFDARVVASELEMPVTLVHGASDIVNPTACVHAWYDELRGPSKDMILFEHTGHLAAFTRPDRFVDVLATVRERVAAA
ncbi:MAG TPA: alpha/beta hydrolase [Jiangellaceae bacterium]